MSSTNRSKEFAREVEKFVYSKDTSKCIVEHNRIFSTDWEYYAVSHTISTDITVRVIRRRKKGSEDQGQLTHVILQAPNKTVKKHLERNILNPKVVDSDVTFTASQCGAWHAEETRHIVERGIRSNRDEQKVKLIDLAQTLCRSLESFERLINNYNLRLSPASNLDRLLSTLSTLNTAIEDISKDCEKKMVVSFSIQINFMGSMRFLKQVC